ncbi:hypothetical protein NQZ68_040503 [Dissostichus eleginoides]|nr:hypothetical protein NQZ68_040503 [Dissostichus eleginoides]
MTGEDTSSQEIPPGGFNSAGQGRPLGVGGSPRGTSPRRWLAPAGRISSAAVRRDRLWVGLERLGAKVARDFGRVLYSALRPDLAASRGRGQSARCALSPPGGGTGPPVPGATVNRGGLSSVRSDRVVPSERGSAHVKGVRGLRRCRQPTRPVLKHGPRMRAGARRLRWDPGPSGLGAPPARLARTVGEVERERVR